MHAIDIKTSPQSKYYYAAFKSCRSETAQENIGKYNQYFWTNIVYTKLKDALVLRWMIVTFESKNR